MNLLSATPLGVALLGVVTADPSPTPSPSGTLEVNPVDVSPGLLGFVVIFALALGLLLLVGDMGRRVRRIRYRGEVSGSGQGSAEQGPTDQRNDGPTHRA